MSLALSKGTCGRTFEMANQNNGRAILCRRRASGRHHMDKTGRKTGNQWATKAGNDKEDTYTLVCILLKSIGAPGRNRTHGPQLRSFLNVVVWIPNNDAISLYCAWIVKNVEVW